VATACIERLRPGEPADCERILRSLPEWFGIESSLRQYVEDCSRLPTWLARMNGAGAGFITLRRHFPGAAEIHCIAVQPQHHRCGVGRALLGFAEDHFRGAGVRFLQVKTLGPSRPSEPYERTRRFYEAEGFTALEEFPTLWPGNPALQMVKAL